jgi:hypothetical protein
MMLGKNALLCLMASILFLTSCAPSPVWVNPVEPAEEGSVDRRLEGAWGQTDYPVLFIGRSLEGWMSFAVSGHGHSDEKILGKMYVSKMDGRNFLNIRIHSPWDLQDFFVIAEYRLDRDDHLFVALPNHEFVRKALEAKKLSGRIEENLSGSEVLVVTSESPEIRAFIHESPKQALFPESPSDVLKRFR